MISRNLDSMTFSDVLYSLWKLLFLEDVKNEVFNRVYFVQNYYALDNKQPE